jgi:hypothetical protein
MCVQSDPSSSPDKPLLEQNLAGVPEKNVGVLKRLYSLGIVGYRFAGTTTATPYLGRQKTGECPIPGRKEPFGLDLHSQV